MKENQKTSMEEYAAAKIAILEEQNRGLREMLDSACTELKCAGSLIGAVSLQHYSPESILTDEECQNALYAVQMYLRRITEDIEKCVVRITA